MSRRCSNADQILDAVANRDGLELSAESVTFFRFKSHKAATPFLMLAALYLNFPLESV